jgi:hypothetical protein
MIEGPIVVDSSNLSYAWAQAFTVSMSRGGEELSQLVVNIRIPEDDPTEDTTVREILDKYLLVGPGKPRRACEVVAKTIFPFTMLRRGQPRDVLYARYRKMVPRLRKHPANRRGIYFERMIMFKPKGLPAEHPGINQLEKIIRDLNGPRSRRSGLQIALFDPTQDHRNTPYLGFPCLQQIAFAESKAGLVLSAFYPMQYLYERAYGNFLGLVKLGRFVADQTALKLARVVCVAGIGKREISKRDALALHAEVDKHVTALGGFQRLDTCQLSLGSR